MTYAFPPRGLPNRTAISEGTAVLIPAYAVLAAVTQRDIVTFFQTVGLGPIGARLPIVQGTSFAFVGVLAGIAATQGLGVALTACIIGGIIHFALGTVIGNLRWLFSPLITALVILATGLYLIPVAIKCAAGGAATVQMEAESFDTLMHWSVALSVVILALVLKFFTKGTTRNAAILIGLIVGYILAYLFGMVAAAVHIVLSEVKMHRRNMVIIAALVFLIGLTMRHFFNTIHMRKGDPIWTWLVTALLFILIMWLSTAPMFRGHEPTSAQGAAVRFAQADGFDRVQDIVPGRCSMCHAAGPAWEGSHWPPKGVRLETEHQIAMAVKEIYLHAGLTHAMPPRTCPTCRPQNAPKSSPGTAPPRNRLGITRKSIWQPLPPPC